MNKTVLNKRWKEILFAAAGFGPNLLMILMSAYLSDALNPIGLSAENAVSMSFTGNPAWPCVFVGIVWFFIAVGKIFDGVVDVPLAAWTDNLRNKTGKRWIGLAIPILPMIISFVCCWLPVFGWTGPVSVTNQILNTIWYFFWSIIFFGSYTLALITFYGSLADVCENQTQRSRVSEYKSVFDTISYALAYAAIPAIVKAVPNFTIWQTVLMLTPLMLTICIPLLMVGKADNKEFVPEKQIPIGKSIVLTMQSRPFKKWIVVYCLSFAGLQLFLVAQNTLILGVMGLDSLGMTILNTAAFAPVPLLLMLFNKVRRSKGIRFAYQTALLAFAVGLLFLNAGSAYFWGDQTAPKIILGVVGSVIGSWGIGAFFMVPYLIPTSIASVEEEVTGHNHSAMYFAVQALFSSAASAISSGLIYETIKNWTITKNEVEYKAGVSLIPFVVFILCILGFIFAFNMPKKYTPQVVYDDLKRTAEKRLNALNIKKERIDSRIDFKIDRVKKSKRDEKQITALTNRIKDSYAIKLQKVEKAIAECEEVINLKFDETKSKGNEEKDLIEKNSMFGVIGLYFLTAALSVIVSNFVDLKKLKVLGKKVKWYEVLLIALGCFIPFLSIYTALFYAKNIDEYSKKHNLNIKTYKVISVITCCVLPCFTNVVELALRTNSFNKISESLD